MLEVQCVVKGRVQGVGYRDFVEQYAKEHSLGGWVKNKEDGSVALVLQGEPEALRFSVEVLHEGSVLAQVESVDVEWKTPKKLFDSFVVIPS